MSRFAIRTPYLIIVSCLIILVLGVSSVARMPVDMFPSMNVPVVIVDSVIEHGDGAVVVRPAGIVLICEVCGSSI